MIAALLLAVSVTGFLCAQHGARLVARWATALVLGGAPVAAVLAVLTVTGAVR